MVWGGRVFARRKVSGGKGRRFRTGMPEAKTLEVFIVGRGRRSGAEVTALWNRNMYA